MWSEGRQGGGCVKDIGKEARPAAVAGKAKQAGEAPIRERWGWAEPSVWTERMLTALEAGVKGGKWFSLMDKVYSGGNLETAWEKVRANQGAAGIDWQSIEAFQANQGKYLGELEGNLREARYEVMPVKRGWVPKAGEKGRNPPGTA